MTNQDETRKQLTQKRDQLQQRLAELERAESAETSRGDTDTAHEWENADVREDLARLTTDELASVQAALDRLDSGEYGVCASCGEPIGAGRLAALPEATACARCAEKMG